MINSQILKTTHPIFTGTVTYVIILAGFLHIRPVDLICEDPSYENIQNKNKIYKIFMQFNITE